jgi:hypothetical protein
MDYSSNVLEQVVNDMDNIPPISMYVYIGSLVDENPNDFVLGTKVRELFQSLREE